MNQSPHRPLAVLGAGSWGTALALHLSRLGQDIRLFAIEHNHVLLMQKERANNRYLSGIPFPESLKPVADLKEAIRDTTDILIAVPSVGFRNTLQQLKPLLSSSQRFLVATKGLDEETGDLLDVVCKNIVGNHSFAVISGPSFAKEVALELPTAVVIASHDAKFAEDLSLRFNSLRFRVYLSKDVTGVELGGVVKNVLGIATGISDGMGFGANARAALITRGLAEMTRLGVALGGHAETFQGLAGLGDLILTCTDNQSRNRRFGLSLGQGQNVDDAEKNIGQVVEGKRNAELIIQLAERSQIEMPIVNAVFCILQNKLSPKDAMMNLLSRPVKFDSK